MVSLSLFCETCRDYCCHYRLSLLFVSCGGFGHVEIDVVGMDAAGMIAVFGP